MKTKKILTGLCLLNGITISTLANSQVSIDLANDDGKTLAKPSASSVTVTIKNMLPTAGYSKYIKHYYPEIAGLPKPDMSNIPGAPALGVKVASQPSEDMDDNAGIMEGKSLFGGVEKAAGDGISPDEIAPLVVDYLSTNIKNECYALFSKSISDVYAADSEKALSSEVDKLNATLKSYSARVKGDYYRTVESIVGNIIDNSLSILPQKNNWNSIVIGASTKSYFNLFNSIYLFIEPTVIFVEQDGYSQISEIPEYNLKVKSGFVYALDKIQISFFGEYFKNNLYGFEHISFNQRSEHHFNDNFGSLGIELKYIF